MEPAEFAVESDIPTPKKSIWPKVIFHGVVALFFAAGVVGGFVWQSLQPTDRALPISFTIEKGQNVTTIADNAEQAGLVRSAFLLRLILSTQFDARTIQASTYTVTESLSAFAVAELFVTGEFTSDLQSIIVIEGESREKIAARLDTKYTWFDPAQFLTLTENDEGLLFPDTYFVPAEYTTEAFVQLLRDRHEEVMGAYTDLIAASDLSPYEIVTLASIIEREANTTESMRQVAGIFFNRLEIGMALQADASIEYALERDLSELRPGELAQSLRELDSPYNTYLYSGLPPTPIGNPGKTAIEAVLQPVDSEYFYYITGNDGEFYYAETFREHQLNIHRHLR